MDHVVQLHEHIEIYYCVDHYTAQLHTKDGRRVVLVGNGATITDAMADLAAQVANLTLEDVRRLPGYIEGDYAPANT